MPIYMTATVKFKRLGVTEGVLVPTQSMLAELGVAMIFMSGRLRIAGLPEHQDAVADWLEAIGWATLEGPQLEVVS